MVEPAARARDDVVDLQIAQLEVLAASGAVPALLAVQVRLVGLGRRPCPDVVAPGQVGPVDNLLEEALIVLEPALHQLHRLLAGIDARPLPVDAFRRHRTRIESPLPSISRSAAPVLGSSAVFSCRSRPSADPRPLVSILSSISRPPSRFAVSLLDPSAGPRSPDRSMCRSFRCVAQDAGRFCVVVCGGHLKRGLTVVAYGLDVGPCVEQGVDCF